LTGVAIGDTTFNVANKIASITAEEGRTALELGTAA
jgi:hypothetical protein